MSEAPRRPRVHTFAALAVPDFRSLWLGNLAANFAMQMQQIARGWLVYELTGSAVLLAWVMLSFAAPMALLSPLGGVLADRWPRRRIIVAAQLANALGTLVLGTFVLLDRASFVHFVAFGALNGTLLAFSLPARQALIPDVVGEARLVNAVALGSMSMNLARVTGPAAAGLLIGAFAAWAAPAGGARLGAGAVLVVNAAMYAFAAATVLRIAHPDRPGAASGLSPLGDLNAGLAYVARTPRLRGLVGFLLAPLALGMPVQALMPVFNEEVLGGGPDELGGLLSAMGLGAIAGSVLLARHPDAGRRGRTLFLLAAAWALSLALFAACRTLPAALGCAAAMGLVSAGYLATNTGLLQLLADPPMRGRVMSLTMTAWSLMPVASLPIGWAAERAGIAPALGACALLLLAGTALGAAALPGLRTLDLRAAPADRATAPAPSRGAGAGSGTTEAVP